MCGIAGILKNITNHDSVLIKDMIQSVRHRGPEETGLYIDDSVALANARLSIIDLSHGAQPIHNEDKSLWIIFNGEIFNYPDLREELVNHGHKFYTDTDTEVIIRLYEVYDNLPSKVKWSVRFCYMEFKIQAIVPGKGPGGNSPAFLYQKKRHFLVRF